MRPIAIITGPTATGKTDSAIAFARAMDGEIISADSMLVYRGMDIGTAKPTPAQRAAVPHHMIDVCDPMEDYSAALWQRGALAAIEDIQSRGKLPVVVGGTGLYIQAVLRPLDFAGAKGQSEAREKWERFLLENGAQALHSALKRVDPETAARLPVGDTRRTIRALEVFDETGMTFTERNRQNAALAPRFQAVSMGVDLARPLLYARIDARVDFMLEQGLVAEVEGLLAAGVPDGCTSMQGLGYKELAAYLRGECTLEQAVEQIKRRTRNFAKRQVTWFNKYGDVNWLPGDTPVDPQQMCDFFLQTYKTRIGGSSHGPK